MSRSLQYPDGCLSVCSLIIQSCNVLIILHFFSNLCTEIGCSIIVIYYCPTWFDMVYLHVQRHCVQAKTYYASSHNDGVRTYQEEVGE